MSLDRTKSGKYYKYPGEKYKRSAGLSKLTYICLNENARKRLLEYTGKKFIYFIGYSRI